MGQRAEAEFELCVQAQAHHCLLGGVQTSLDSGSLRGSYVRARTKVLWSLLWDLPSTKSLCNNEWLPQRTRYLRFFKNNFSPKASRNMFLRKYLERLMTKWRRQIFLVATGWLRVHLEVGAYSAHNHSFQILRHSLKVALICSNACHCITQ